jgi:hypothetical protein
MWVGLSILVLSLLTFLVAVAMRAGGGDTSTPTPSPSMAGTQQTLLIQVRNDDNLGANNMIAAVGGGLPSAQLLVPSRLMVDVPGAGQQTLGQSARLLDRSASQDALSDLLAVRIDATLSLSRLALAGMVDFVGGITVTVESPIREVDPATGVETEVVPAGSNALNGSQSAAYALAWQTGDPEATRLAHFSAVITETIRKLPDDQGAVELMLTSLGGSARTTTAAGAVAELLVAMRRDLAADGALVRVLPTTDLQAVTELAVVRVDLPAAQEAIDTVLPMARLATDAGSQRVLVRNGVGRPGLGSIARDRLVGAGLVFINGGNADEFGQPRTLILLPDETPAAQALGERIANALQVPASAVEVAPDGQNVAAAVVVLGEDFDKWAP